MKPRLAALLLAFVLLVLGTRLGWAKTDNLRATLSLTERSSDRGDSTDYAWAFGGSWSDLWGPHLASLTVQSDYSHSSNGSEYDRLKTWWRYTLKTPRPGRWTPLLVISTEGPHDCQQLQTLGAFAMRRAFTGGFLELSAGASKDVRTAEAWTGDLGALISFNRRWGKFGWSVRPQGNLGALGEARLRSDRFLYTLDTTLDYSLSSNFGVTYRLQAGNTLVDAHHIEFLGLTYKH